MEVACGMNCTYPTALLNRFKRGGSATEQSLERRYPSKTETQALACIRSLHDCLCACRICQSICFLLRNVCYYGVCHSSINK